VKLDFPNYSQRVSKNHSQVKNIFHFYHAVVFLRLPLTLKYTQPLPKNMRKVNPIMRNPTHLLPLQGNHYL